MLDSEPLTSTSDTSCKAQSLIMMNAISPGVFDLFVQGLDIVLVFTQPSLWLSFPEHTVGLLVVMLRCSQQ
jgi:hypothetical protein